MPYRLFAVPLALCLLVPSGCASSLQRSIEAYERGDFREAHELLTRVEPGEAQEVREAVAGGIEYSSSYLLSQAWVALERGRGPKPLREARAYYRAALAVMPSDHPRRAATLASIAELERDIAEVRERRQAAVRRFRVAADKRDYAGAVQVVGEVLELTSSVGGDQPGSSEVLALAERAIGDGDHNFAVQLVELADLVRREANARVGDSDMGEIARVAAALRYFHRVAAELDEADGKTIVRRPGRRKPEPVRPEPLRKPELVTTVPGLDGDEVEREREQAATSRLKRARAQWAAGDKYDALCTLDRAIAMLGDVVGLAEQRQRWRPARDLLIADYIERGEMALSREASTEARGWYQRILALDPDHELARDRMHKLDKLQELQSGDR